MGNHGSAEAINFYGDKFNAVKYDSNIYVVAGDILRNLGFDSNKVNNQIKAWKNDLVVKAGLTILTVLTNGGTQEAYCLAEKYVPLALAKISITPTMQKNQPEVVKKLVLYQVECGAVLYKHFHGTVKPLDTDTPLSREEMAMYFASMMNAFREYSNIMAARDNERNKLFADYLKVQTDNIDKITSYLPEFINATKSVVIENKTEVESMNVSTEPEFNTYTWKSSMKAACRKVAPLLGYKDYKYVIKYICDQMEKEFPDFIDHYKEYVSSLPYKSGSKIAMISNHEAYRVVFERILKDIADGKVGVVAGKKKNNSKAPAEFVDEISKLGKPYPRLYEKVYRRMERDFGVNIEEITKAAKLKYGSGCSAAYAITADEGLFKVFCDAVTSLLAEVA